MAKPNTNRGVTLLPRLDPAQGRCFRAAKRSEVAMVTQDARRIFRRFPVKLVEIEGDASPPGRSFMPATVERSFAVMAAVVALATRLFGGFGDARADKKRLNQVKKRADLIATLTLHECIWQITRDFPADCVLMVGLGEGALQKGGDIGGSPMLGFPRVYGQPETAAWVERLFRIAMAGELGWERVDATIRARGVTTWSMALDTLENTGLFAEGENGALTVAHVFDRMTRFRLPYEAYWGILSVPRDIDPEGALNFLSPRADVFAAIKRKYPGIKARNIHVFTLNGTKIREKRLAGIWGEWANKRVHLIEPNWPLPTGEPAITTSGTYAPMFQVGAYKDDRGHQHIIIMDGYAASTESVQAASLDTALKLRTSLCPFTPDFQFACDRESKLMQLDPESPEFGCKVVEVAGENLTGEEVEQCAQALRHARRANVPIGLGPISAADMFPGGAFQALGFNGSIASDPNSTMRGIEIVDEARRRYRVPVRVASEHGVSLRHFELELTQSLESARRAFLPLLDLYSERGCRRTADQYVDSGRLKNELITSYYEGLEPLADGGYRMDLSRIDSEVVSQEKKLALTSLMGRLKKHSPENYEWLALQ